jgi:taurine dioxygenase
MIEICRTAGALGAEITGIDISTGLDDGTIAAIRRAWLDHLVIFFRGQTLTPERFLAFARRFGRPPTRQGRPRSALSRDADA